MQALSQCIACLLMLRIWLQQTYAVHEQRFKAAVFKGLSFLQAWGLKSSLRKLQRSRSHIMATYYGFLWAITVLNLFRCILQMVQTGSSHATPWNVLWLLTRFGEHAAAAAAALQPDLSSISNSSTPAWPQLQQQHQVCMHSTCLNLTLRSVYMLCSSRNTLY